MIPEDEHYTPDKGEGYLSFAIHPIYTDAEKLAAFEAFVQSQQPASTPWQPVTDYSFEARKAIEGIHPQLIKDVFQPARVLDVGCGPGHLVRLLYALGVSVSGCDVQSYREWMNAPCFRCQDITDPPDGTRLRLYDVVICRELLEHLTIRQIRHAVTNLCALSSQYVYVTTRFVKAPQHLLDVDTSDDLDPDHRTMLNQNLLRLLFVLEGFKRRADLEERMDHQKKGRVLVYERA